MNFSSGQIAFIIFFLLAFLIGMVLAYRKDIKIHKSQYKGAGKTVLAVMVTFTVVYCVIRFFIYKY